MRRLQTCLRGTVEVFYQPYSARRLSCRVSPFICGRTAASSWQSVTKLTEMCTTASICSSVRHCSSSASSAESTSEDGEGALEIKHPVVQFPARSLLARQRDLDIAEVKRGEYESMIAALRETRHYYQYPSLSAPQIGWNVRVFTMFDGSVWINPEVLEVNCPPPTLEATGTENSAADASPATCSTPKNCWAWEPCASCAFLLHYIERPSTVKLRAIDETGSVVETVLTGMRARFALHEMDHMDGILFTRRIPDTNHVVLADGFSTMSDWSDDYPTLEARSTFLYTTFTPPYTFQTDAVHDANMLDRKFEDNIYPGHEMDKQLRIANVAYEEVQRAQWKMVKRQHQGDSAEMTPQASDEDHVGCEEDDNSAAVSDNAKDNNGKG